MRVSPAELSGRDLLHRAALFSSAADPVWDVLGTVVGPISAARVLGLSQEHDLVPCRIEAAEVDAIAVPVTFAHEGYVLYE